MLISKHCQKVFAFQKMKIISLIMIDSFLIKNYPATPIWYRPRRKKRRKSDIFPII